MSKQDELKALNKQAKELNEQRKKLREETNANKDERIAARKTQAEQRKVVKTLKADLRTLVATTSKTFKSGDSESIGMMADEVIEVSTQLAAAIRSFGEAAETLDDL